MIIHQDGYEEYKQEITISATEPSNLGTIQLVPMAGNLSLSSPQSDVTYKITGPNNYEHDGQLPDELDKLPIGDYFVTVTYQDWTLPAVPISIHDHDSVHKEIKFPYARLDLSSVPPGATVRQGRTVLGQTPLSLNDLRPTDMHLTVDLAPYTLQHVDVHLGDFANVSKQVKMVQDKDFIAACGMPMVWIPDGGFWAGKYEVRQSDYEPIAGSNPSTFNRPTRPVDNVSWKAAMSYIDKLNQSEAAAGKLPKGYHYSLPKESQWDVLNDDASIDNAATSRVTTLASTQDAGYSEPNKYGLFDTIGNVWEWCLDAYDDKGDHSLRGGCWLSSAEHFPSADTRNGAPPDYADQFTGFRVVLVPN
jgi:formylglycine-generating enzyme required for sulfatase activity